MTAAGRPARPGPVQRRTIGTLVVAQAIGAVGITIGIATASLLARDISGSESQAGLAQTVPGARRGGGVVPARPADVAARPPGRPGHGLPARCRRRRARRRRRRRSTRCRCCWSAPYCSASTTAANSGARYAATDLAPAERRARALSTVVWATTIGAVAGPNLTGPVGRAGGPARHPRADRPVRARQRSACCGRRS